MSTQGIGQAAERDILDVMREIEAGSAPKPHEDDAAGSKPAQAQGAIDTDHLYDSIKKKYEVMRLLEGYAGSPGIAEKRQELKEALEFLEELNTALDDE